ncbi:hypothetical protein C0993_000658, partial [Termitomyces sp. T159_Od127]
AGGKDDPHAGIKTEDDDEANSVSDGDDHLYVSTVEPEGLVEQLNISENPNPTVGQGSKMNKDDTVIDEQLHQDIESARDNMTPEERTRIDKRMEKVSFLPEPENNREEGKVTDPRNWGAIDPRRM